MYTHTHTTACNTWHIYTILLLPLPLSLSLSSPPSPYLSSHFRCLVCVVEGRRVVILFLVTLYPDKLDSRDLLWTVWWKLRLARQLVLIEQLGW
jgi:hypothetical protein